MISTVEDVKTKLIRLIISFFQKQSDSMFLKLIIKKMYTANTEDIISL